MAQVLFTIFAILSTSLFAGVMPSLPAEEIGVVHNPTAVHIQRTIKTLENSTAQKPARLRVLFYGQSIVEQGWHEYMIKALEEKYPTARISVANKAIGGYEAGHLIRTAESDLYPYYPDILFFHVYGSLEKYEQIIKKVRAVTSAEIVLWSSHLRSDDDPKALLASPDKRTLKIQDIAARYNCMYIDLRKKWCKMLIANNWHPKEMLRDQVHLKSEKRGSMAKKYYAGFIGEELCSIKGAQGNPLESGRIETIKLDDKRVKKLADGTILLSFKGNRVAAILDNVCNAPLSLKLDGKDVSTYPQMYVNTRPSKLVSWQPMIRFVECAQDAMPQKEDWTLTYIEGTKPLGPVVYKVEGSVTGFDGEGRSDQDFVSKSGRAIIKSSDFQGIAQYEYFVKPKIKPGEELPKKCAKAGEKITWRTVPLFAENLNEADEEKYMVLLQNCANKEHTLLLSAPCGLNGIKEFIVYSPKNAQ